MPFAAQLRELLRFRESEVPASFAKGEPLESVLDRHLLAVEWSADSDMVTSILLLDGTTLHHGAGPRLPRAYRDAIDGSEIGPVAGSCGTAAFLGRPVYVSDIANDPLWANYKDLALDHGLRACWSTPIRNPRGPVAGNIRNLSQKGTEPERRKRSNPSGRSPSTLRARSCGIAAQTMKRTTRLPSMGSRHDRR